MPREADRILLSRYSPPGVLVNSDLEILQFRGDTSSFLAPAPGKASMNLLKMLREGLLGGIRSAMMAARADNVTVRKDGLQVRSGGKRTKVNVESHSAQGTGSVRRLLSGAVSDPRLGSRFSLLEGRPGAGGRQGGQP
jgi:two-component system CheB/CheR fusion protein